MTRIRSRGRAARLAGGLAGLLLALSCSGGRSAPDGSGVAGSDVALNGAWTLLRSETRAVDGTVYPGSPQESFLLFADPFYSMNAAAGGGPSSYYETRFRPTEAEKLDRYDRLLVNAGRYRAADGRLTIRPTFALVPEYIGGTGGFEYELLGDTLRLIWQDIRSVDGVQDPGTARGWTYRYTWVRVR